MASRNQSGLTRLGLLAASSVFFAGARVRGQNASRLILPEDSDGNKQRLVKKAVNRNAPCPCGSDKKFKNCCGSPTRKNSNHPQPRPLPQSEAVAAAPSSRKPTVLSMAKAKIQDKFIWAYLHTGLFVTDQSRAHNDEATVQLWDKSLASYDAASVEERQQFFSEATEGEWTGS